MSEPSLSEARRYLLGTATDQECSAIERRYFAADESRLAIEAAEDQLIEEYLSGDLSALERQQFEGHYLASPVHRRRVQVVRALASPRSRVRSYRWLAVAAALIIAIGAIRLLAPQRLPPPPGMVTVSSGPTGGDKPLPPAPRPPSLFAFALSPINVRSERPSSPLVIPTGTDVVLLELQQEGRAPRIADRTATIRTVEGREVWKGSAAIDNVRTGLLARIEVPASQLPADDYFVEIAGYRYFLPVRAKD